VVGTSGRVFPEAFRATPLLRAWLRRLDDAGVTLRTRSRWLGWDEDGRLRFGGGGDDEGDGIVEAEATVLALGGASWPRTGSDGAWVELVRDAGIAVTPLRPANGGFVVDWSTVFRDRFAGSVVKTVSLSVGGASARGDLVLTTTGIEGGPVYALGRRLREDPAGVVTIDLRPDLDAGELAMRLENRRRPKDSVSSTLRRTAGLSPAAVALLREAGALPSSAPALARRIKDVRLRLVGPQPIDRAISTAGGIALDEVDERFMLRRRPGTFVAGEMLDWEAPTGGYLLQATFSTAVAAAHGVLDWLRTEAT
jgi:uncharacterized flavoprotein (TIGR03862 family)